MQFDIESILESLGVENVRVGHKEISASCPMHEEILGRPDRHASWSINRHTGAHNCFSCGWKGGLATLYRDLTGEVPDDIDMEIRRASLVSAIEGGGLLSADDVDLQWVWPSWLPEVPEKMLAIRNLDGGSARAYDVRWSPDTREWVVPVHDEWGEPVGAQYRQMGSVLTQPPGLSKGKYLFGLWSMRNHDHVALVESPLDAVRLHSVGVPAVSSLGAWVSEDQCKLLARHFNYVVVALDNDAVGREAAARVVSTLRRLGCPTIVFDYTGLPGKDPGDVDDDDLLYQAWNRTLSLL